MAKEDSIVHCRWEREIISYQMNIPVAGEKLGITLTSRIWLRQT